MRNLNKQHQRILDYLTDVGSITSYKGLIELGIGRTQARIGELKQMGYAIETKRVSVSNRWGEKASVAEYSLRGAEG